MRLRKMTNREKKGKKLILGKAKRFMTLDQYLFFKNEYQGYLRLQRIV